jgi:predicted transposase YbfD/YdcC
MAPTKINPVELQNVETIMEEFAELRDPRETTNRKHQLGDVIVISIMGVLAGGDGPAAIESWAKANQAWLQQHLELPHGIPSHDTIGRVLAALKPEAFQNCFQSWVGRVAPSEAGGSEHIAIDGKVLRQSHDQPRGMGPLWLVSAWSVDRGISLGQLAADEKSNEITAIPEVLNHLELEGTVVTIDAAGTQKKIAKQIIDGGGDYILSLKGNQKTIHEQVKAYFERKMENDFADISIRTFHEHLRGHGRRDDLTYYQTKVPEELTTQKAWAGLRTIGVVVRISEVNGKETYDTRYYLSSLRMGIKNFARYVRGHWSIENTLHWSLDVTFREDASRIRDRNTANNLGWLRRFALSCLKQVNDKLSVAMRRRMAGWNIEYAAETLGITAKSVR